jgi:hypothetical protein
MNKQKWIYIALCAIFLFAGYSIAAAAHPNVPLLDKDGIAVSGNTPYSPKMTCSANACHQGDQALAAKHDYGSGDKTVSQHVGRVLADGTVAFATQNVKAYAHGVSVGKHMNMGRNENYTPEMRTAWKQGFFTSTPGMFGRY